jgi:hypothetical protein
MGGYLKGEDVGLLVINSMVSEYQSR